MYIIYQKVNDQLIAYKFKLDVTKKYQSSVNAFSSGGYDLEFHLEFLGRFLQVYALLNNNSNKQYICYRWYF